MFVQLVQSRLKDPNAHDVFLALTQDMLAWLRVQAGFVAYELYEGDGYFFDRLVWEDESCCRAAADRFMETGTAFSMLALVQPEIHTLFGEEIVVAAAQPVA
ncbi:hypothetical protein [Silvimonas amylolytica]|uniref:Quinol monooxygenase YgiN n=1 Tax=Silvimonas amylolytica TaxID=449663 RepID=A0ABQ2PNJ9_9NEIS|nr:hypothetical protein [Silvimonas amylolytica]GGP26549.1 hypothetical protein GCM10010971_23680 [Silvimonas amylolytica]